MKKKDCIGMSVAFIVGVVTVLIYCHYKPRWEFVLRGRSHAIAANFNGMRALYECIDSAAITAPESFAKAVGGEMDTNALALPPVITANFVFTTNQISNLYWDTWGHPFNVSITPDSTSVSNELRFSLRIWSNGPNGSNEDRKGDDIYLEWPQLKISVR